MAVVKFLRGNNTSLDTAQKQDGCIYFCMDDGSIYIDYIDSAGVIQRKQLNAKDAETLGGRDLTTILDYVTKELVEDLKPEIYYYSTLSSAITDIEADTVENAIANTDEANVKVFTSCDGVKTILLLKDLLETNQINITKNMNIDLGGKTLSFEHSAAFIQASSESIKISNGSIFVDISGGVPSAGLFRSTSNQLTMENVSINVIGGVSSQFIGLFLQNTNGVFDIKNCNIDVKNNLERAIAIYHYQGILNVENTTIKADTDSAKSAYGIANYDRANVIESTIFADAPDNSVDSNGYAIGIQNDAILYATNTNVSGTHSGLSTTGSAYISGGVYDSCSHGGMYILNNGEGETFVKDATIRCGDYTGVHDSTLFSNTKLAALYFGDSGENSNGEIAYFDGCTIEAVGANHVVALRDSHGEDINVFNISNSTISEGTNYIRMDGPTIKLNIGVGTNITTNRLGSTSNYEYTNELYRKFGNDTDILGKDFNSIFEACATKNELSKEKTKLIGDTEDISSDNTIYGAKAYARELIGYGSSTVTREGSIIALQNITSENITVTCSNSTLEDISTETIISCGKNLLKNTASNKTSQGITFTKNSEGVTVVGTATANSFYYPNENFYLPAGNYHLSGCPNGGSSSTYYLSIQKVESETVSLIGRDFGNGLDFTVPEGVTLKVFIGVVSGQTVDLNFKPMIELASVATNEYEPYTETIYTVDSAGNVPNVVFNPPITILYGSTENTILTVTSEQQESCIDILQGWREAAYGKIDNLFEQATAAPIITFIDDDTTDLAAVQRFKNTCDELGIVGGFAVVTSNLDSQPELAEALQEYEKEGFHMCLHCDVHNRFYAPATRDYAQCRSDFVTGIRKMKKYQFADPMFWCIPYGSPDKEMEDMAKKWGMECLVASGCNSYETAEAKNGRFALRRCSLDPTDDGALTTLDRLKQLVRMAVAENGWLLITTHFTEDGWIDNQDRFKELVNYALEQGMQVKTLNEAYRIREPIYRLYEAF